MARKNVTMFTAKAAPPRRLLRNAVQEGRDPEASCMPVMSGTASHMRTKTTVNDGAVIAW